VNSDRTSSEYKLKQWAKDQFNHEKNFNLFWKELIK